MPIYFVVLRKALLTLSRGSTCRPAAREAVSLWEGLASASPSLLVALSGR